MDFYKAFTTVFFPQAKYIKESREDNVSWYRPFIETPGEAILGASWSLALAAAQAISLTTSAYNPEDAKYFIPVLLIANLTTGYLSNEYIYDQSEKKIAEWENQRLLRESLEGHDNRTEQKINTLDTRLSTQN